MSPRGPASVCAGEGKLRGGKGAPHEYPLLLRLLRSCSERQ